MTGRYRRNTRRSNSNPLPRSVRTPVKQRREVAELHERDERYRAIFEQSTDSIVLVDSKGAFADFNTAAHKGLGYTREEFEKLTLPDIEGMESPKQVRTHMKRFVRAGSCCFETKHMTKGGEPRDVVVTARTIRISGKLFFAALWRDITGQKKARDALQRKNVALREVLNNVQQEKDEIARRVTDNVQRIIIPMVLELEREVSPDQQRQLAALKRGLEEITSPLVAKLSNGLGHLTPVELRICNFVRSGMATKEIAQVQHISERTVSKHRENIRHKLGITGKNVNLASHLDALLSQSTEG